MSAATMFAIAARTPPLTPPQRGTAGEGKITGTPRVMMDGQHTIMKLCGTCHQQMPHKIGSDMCILCELDDVVSTHQDDDSG